MSQVIDDTISAMNGTYDDASTMLDNTVPLGEFLDEQIAKAKETENVETLENYDSPIMPSSPTRVEMPETSDGYVFDRETARVILACNDRDDVLRRWFRSVIFPIGPFWGRCQRSRNETHYLPLRNSIGMQAYMHEEQSPQNPIVCSVDDLRCFVRHQSIQ